MALSSKTLFHFTAKCDSLKAILKEGISPSYCGEVLPYEGQLKRYRIPMISFCDIPLSEVDSISGYGSYAIGLTMEWGKKHKMNPVLYVDNDSMVAHYIYKSAKLIVNKRDELNKFLDAQYDGEEFKNLWIGYASIVCSCKLYAGDLHRDGKLVKKDYKFCNEREWRYLPFDSFPTSKDSPPRWSSDDHWKKHWASSYASKPHLPKYSLKIRPTDVKYIILADETEIHDFVDFLGNLTGDGWSKKSVELLTTKIITSKQISEDF